MRAIILAGGKGKRLRPLTDYIAKPLLPIKGKPIIQQIIENLSAANIKDIVIVVGYLGHQIRDYLGSGESAGVTIKYLEQKEQLGMAHALNIARDYINGDCLVAASDSIFPVQHIKKLINFHISENCDATITLKKLESIEEITHCSNVKLEKDFSITRIIEKPTYDQIISNISGSPLYIFKEVIKEYLPKVEKSQRQEYEIQSAIQAMIDDGLVV
ncbi:MAG: nucleotidyltransferase family protein, partial [Methanosarcinales archaeon]